MCSGRSGRRSHGAGNEIVGEGSGGLGSCRCYSKPTREFDGQLNRALVYLLYSCGHSCTKLAVVSNYDTLYDCTLSSSLSPSLVPPI